VKLVALKNRRFKQSGPSFPRHTLCLSVGKINNFYIFNLIRRNCLLKEVIEGKIKVRLVVTRRRGRRRKKSLNDLGDRRGYSHLKEEALDRIKWRNRFGRGFGPVVCLTDY
jgi:hypothetical protein